MTATLAPWLQRTWAHLGGPLAAGRLGHALLLTGQAGLGQRDLAHALAQRLICTHPSDASAMACGRCRGCQLFLAGNHPDIRDVGIELNEKTGKLRSEILVEQIRQLGQWFSLTAQFGGAQVAVIEPADMMKGAAANALLKTLEEPLPNRYLVLVTAFSGRLPATIRSRCQRIDVGLPPADEARAWMRAQSVDTGVIDESLQAAEGNPGLALRYVSDQTLALRHEVQRDLAALAAGRERPLAVAMRWSDESAAERLRFAATTARDLARQRFGSIDDPSLARVGLTAVGDFSKLAAWFDEANRVRTLLESPLRADLLLLGLLQHWTAAVRL